MQKSELRKSPTMNVCGLESSWRFHRRRLGFDHVCRTCGKECFKRQCQTHFSGKTQLNPSQIVGSNPPFAAVAADHWTRTERQNALCWRPLRAWPRAFPSLIKGSGTLIFSTLVTFTFLWNATLEDIDVN